MLLTLGEPVPYVPEQMGHTDPKVTLGIYTRVMRRADGSASGWGRSSKARFRRVFGADRVPERQEAEAARAA